MSTRGLTDTAILLGRCLRHVRRSPDTIITTAITPVAMLLLFVYVFGGAIATGSAGVEEPYITYLLPGILRITIASGVAYTAFRLFGDRRSGIVARFDSMPIARSALLWAHVFTSVIANLLAVAIVVGVAVLMGFRSSAGVSEWLAVAGVLLLFTPALTWLAVIPGLLATTVDGAGGFAYPLIFLPFLSSAFVPTATMPTPVRLFAEHRPVTAIVDAIRALLGGHSVGSDIWTALGWCVGILVLTYLVATALYRRKIT